MSYLPEEGVDELGEGAHGVQLQLDLAKEAEVHIRRGQADLAGVGEEEEDRVTSGRYWSKMKARMSSGRLKASISWGMTKST